LCVLAPLFLLSSFVLTVFTLADDWWGIDPLQHEDGRVIYWSAAWGSSSSPRSPAPFLPSLTSPPLAGVPTNGFDSQTLLPQGLAIKIDQTGRDSSKWCLVGLLWDNVYYTSIAEFRKAWENGTMGKPTRNVGVNETWPGTDKAGPGSSFLPYYTFLSFDTNRFFFFSALPYDDRVAPMPIAPGGQRFAVDEGAQSVAWGE
jgi:primary-amine oxidase